MLSLFGVFDLFCFKLSDRLLGIFLKSQAHTYGRLPDTPDPILVKLQYPDFDNKAH